MGSVTDFKLKQLSKAWLKLVIFVAFEGKVSSNKLTQLRNAWLNEVIADGKFDVSDSNTMISFLKSQK